ncbi:MAG TPA: isoleucine--tRNA ligase [Dehalococcoidales bacterium]|nr:isoleucine--tRNA ligase [Dehalococcoidales bacterium]
MFKPVSSKIDFSKVEENILPLWKEKSIFEKSVETRKGAPRFTLYEGPPTANGNPGIHHVLARVYKDIIPRYKTMKGCYAPRIAGWDTHGLPVELEVEKKLGLSSKTQIEEYGIARFNEKCKESVHGYLANWNKMTERIGYWCDMQHPYVTMDNEYIESVWWTIKQLWDKGLIYQGYRVTPHCPRCGTSLSSHEVAQGYVDDTVDPSVYPKFRVISFADSSLKSYLSQKPVYLMAWTTTPWTLPGNTALAVSAPADYAVLENGESFIILADQLREKVGLNDLKVIEVIKGSKLVDTRYEPLYNPHRFNVERRRAELFKGPDGVERKEFRVQPVDLNLTYPVIAADFVTMDEGSGIVHVAPAFGEVDFNAGLERGLDFVQQVDLAGKITGTYSFAGKFVKTADKDIIFDLNQRALLNKSGTVTHTYPFCWRCNTPLLYYAKQTWYIRTTASKDRLLANNAKINWFPEHIKNGRFGDWLENNVDWAFSRERYWGTPLPVWRCESCSKVECMGSFAELASRSGQDVESVKSARLGMHRPNVDEITLKCACGSQMKRASEVIDCWLDSGNMSLAQYHYPFDPSSLAIHQDGRFPADYICEGVDQTRGWFYSLHALSTLLFDQPCFKNVICTGHVLDAQGEKMSKTRGNVVDPWKIINKYGADALRWYLLVATPAGNVKRFAEEQVADITRQFQLILWNVYSFFVMYANIDNYKPEANIKLNSENELDRWILSELNQLIREVDNDLGNYNPTDAGRKMEIFVDNLSNWYVRRSRRRFWKSGNDADKIGAYNTLYTCLTSFIKLLAPFMPFMAEEMYQNLVKSVYPDAPESIHLTDFPAADESRIDVQLSVATRMAIKVSSLGRAARSGANVKVRQPLSKLVVVLKSRTERESLNQLKSQIVEELNVKDIECIDDHEALQKLGYACMTEGDISVGLCTAVTAELEREGMAREIVHRIQTMRKTAGFEIADYILTYWEGDEYMGDVMTDTQTAVYIKNEVLARALTSGVPEEGVYAESFKLGGHPIKLGVKKA